MHKVIHAKHFARIQNNNDEAITTENTFSDKTVPSQLSIELGPRTYSSPTPQIPQFHLQTDTITKT